MDVLLGDRIGKNDAIQASWNVAVELRLQRNVGLCTFLAG